LSKWEARAVGDRGFVVGSGGGEEALKEENAFSVEEGALKGTG
jgi:hypothetical protein